MTRSSCAVRASLGGIALSLALALACGPSGSSSTAPDPEAAEAASDDDEGDLDSEDARPPGHGSCCADNRCRFDTYPGRREWSQACREQGAEMGQWCPGECMVDQDARPPRCVCI